MAFKNTKLFTTGQFAKMHDINNRTLHYYDDIGLFSPAHKGENGYRYYTYSQSPILEMLLAMRELNMSIEEIDAYMNNRSADAFRNILQMKMTDIDATIQRLTQLRQLLLEKEKQITLSEHVILDTIEIITCSEDYVLLSSPLTSSFDEDDLAILNEHMQKAKDYRLFNQRYGTMISVEKILEKAFHSYNYYYSVIDGGERNNRLSIKPAGTYIRIFSKGNWEQLPNVYEKIVSFAKNDSWKLTGYAYEEGINEMTIASMDDYITQISIRCEKF
ncbi:MerR family transcriptional regulator [Paraliobacillus salinarum]|uniref:MerR family transcriptional regulator n=1 Tax=Paraliobacillus salinarum TaxID=1158996 RepID=UPI0015F70DB7|nr:MerR family transcriptional regulator [Paraliobacillus salinarum]